MTSRLWAMPTIMRYTQWVLSCYVHLATFIIKYSPINSFLWFQKLPKCFFNFRWDFQRTFLTSKKHWQLDTIKMWQAIKNVKHVYYLLLWMHLWVLNQNLWHKRGVKNMTIRHTSRRVVAPTCRPITTWGSFGPVTASRCQPAEL